jgi:hypothetical protein
MFNIHYKKNISLIIMTYLVSILIPTLIERRQVFNKLIDKLYKQIEEGNYQKKIEILSICDDRSVKLCDKRNTLQKLSRGKYFLTSVMMMMN